MDDENEQGTLKSQLLKKTTTWKHEFEDHQSQVEKLEDKLMEVKVEMKCTEDDSKELAYLWRGVKNHCNNASLPEIESPLLAALSLSENHSYDQSDGFKLLKSFSTGLIAETTHLESEKVKKEAEVKTLIEDNVRLRVLLDKKEAQLLAMNVQCKWMSLKRSGHIASSFTSPSSYLLIFEC
ncbi:unnamed protein product [Musa acuminata subsp. malaccensis]|uniref:(wild Malaysian banana) hypothetical protein n=1 Tax=Musa acuminata subsp. malaccensis TaxID=214687 RepID=A0A804ICE1_MUSAM|nr:unnamed protein product [Musa acuminata subsp. malaccensis]